MSSIFDEENCFQTLEKYLPNGEKLLAAIHGIGVKYDIKQYYGGVEVKDNMLVLSDNHEILMLGKKKEASFDVYVGITENNLVIAECEPTLYSYPYEFINDIVHDEINYLDSPLSFKEIGHVFALDDIKSCELKKIWMGAVNCLITLENGSFLKITLPKLGGLGGGMPNHKEYRQKIVDCLSRFNNQ